MYNFQNCVQNPQFPHAISSHRRFSLTRRCWFVVCLLWVWSALVISGCSGGGGSSHDDSAIGGGGDTVTYEEGWDIGDTTPLDTDDDQAQLEETFQDCEEFSFPEENWISPVEISDGEDTVEYDLTTGRERIIPVEELLQENLPLSRDEICSEESPWVFEDMETRQIIGKDDRKKISDTTVYPFCTACKIYSRFPNGKVYACSGTVIANKYVITAGYTVYSHDDGGWLSSVTVIPALNGTYKPYGSYSGVQCRTFVGWTQHRDYKYGMALITVDKNIGDKTGWLGYGYWSSINGWDAHGCNYPGDKDQGLGMYYCKKKMYDISGNSMLFRYTMDDYPGSGGGGIYWQDSSDRRFVTGVVSHTVNSDPNYNYACKINENKFNSLKSWIASGQ